MHRNSGYREMLDGGGLPPSCTNHSQLFPAMVLSTQLVFSPASLEGALALLLLVNFFKTESQFRKHAELRSGKNYHG